MSPSIRRLFPAMAALVAATGLPWGGAAGQEPARSRITPANDLPDPYRRVQPWGDLDGGPYSERAAYIGVEQGPDGNIYLLTRCRGNSCSGRPEAPVLKLDPSGKLLRRWGAGMFDFPHGFAVDHEGNVWATDQRRHQVFKWTAEGELLLKLGEKGLAGDPPDRLNEPTDVAITPDGTIFVTEGHSFNQGANRVSKFARDGSFLMSWGTTGSGPGEFNVPHAVALDPEGRVFVGDRANNRIQVFDQEGCLLDVWYQFGRPSGIAITADGRIYVADSESWGPDNPGWKKGIRVGNARDGAVQYLIEDIESTAMEHAGAEGVAVDSEGNVFGAVVRRRMLEKHVPAGTPPSPPAVSRDPSHLGHLAMGFGATPGGRGLVATATTEAGIALFHANLAAGDLSDLESMQLHAGHVLQALAPEAGSRGPGLGYGLIRAVEDVATHIGLAADSPGASEVVRTQATQVTAIARDLVQRAERAAAVSRRLQEATSVREASPLVAEMLLLTYRIAEGGDLNGDGELSQGDGEAGLQQLEGHVYLVLEAEGLPRILR